MASSNINKIVSGNLNLKPSLLAKTTTGIVSSCVEKLYRQISDNFKNELNGIHATADQRHKVHQVRVIRPNTMSIINRLPPKPKAKTHRAAAPLNSNKEHINFVKEPKKLLKSKNFKIYSKRLYGSSATSSNASFGRGSPEDVRKKLYKPTYKLHSRHYAESRVVAESSKASAEVPGFAKYNPQGRLYNETNTQKKMLELTSVICKDLMSIDDKLKQVIRIKKDKHLTDTSGMNRQEQVELSFHGWNHPSSDYLKYINQNLYKGEDEHKQREPTVDHKNNTLARRFGSNLMTITKNSKQTPRITEPTIYSHGIQWPTYRLENARFQTSNIPSYTGAKLKNPDKATIQEPSKQRYLKAVERDVNPMNDNSFVCRSRKTRSVRSPKQSSSADEPNRHRYYK